MGKPSVTSSVLWLAKLSSRVFPSIARADARHPYTVILLCVSAGLAMIFGISNIAISSDPDKIWVPPGSTTSRQQDHFNSVFSPFYRIEQLIFTLSPEARCVLAACPLGTLARRTFSGGRAAVLLRGLAPHALSSCTAMHSDVLCGERAAGVCRAAGPLGRALRRRVPCHAEALHAPRYHVRSRCAHCPAQRASGGARPLGLAARFDASARCARALWTVQLTWWHAALARSFFVLQAVAVAVVHRVHACAALASASLAAPVATLALLLRDACVHAAVVRLPRCSSRCVARCVALAGRSEATATCCCRSS
jgi:hypothetical protein